MGQLHQSSVSTLIAGVAALAAIISAIATAVLSRLTSRLAKANENYARLMQEELRLLKAQMEVPLLMGIRWFAGLRPALNLTCEHPGAPTALPVIIRKTVIFFETSQKKESINISDEEDFRDFLKPGTSWRRQVAPKISAHFLRSPKPNVFKVILRTQPRRFALGRLTVSLRYERAEKIEETSREYEVHAFFSGDVVFTRVVD